MALVVRLWRFEKYRNSTANPTSMGIDPALEMTCVLKDPCSVQTPRLILHFNNDSGFPGHYNYCYIGEFQRFYFIMDWVCINNTMWEVVCNVDLCGTFRDYIRESEQFVLRAEKSSNGTIADSLAVGTAKYSSRRTGIKQPYGNGGGCMILSVGGGTNTNYVIDEGHLISICQFMFSDRYADAVLPNWAELEPGLKAQLNPLQYINSLRSYPFNFEGANRQTIKIGFVNTPISAPTMPSGYGATFTFLEPAFTVPSHPQSGTLPYTAQAPYSRYGVWYPPFGDIELDPGAVVAAGYQIVAEISVDMLSGNSVAQFWAGSALAGSAEGKLGVDVAISQTYRTGFGLSNTIGAAAGVGSALAMGNITGAIAGFAEGMRQIGDSMVPKMRVVGSNGGASASLGLAWAYGTFQEVVAPSPHFAGRPLYRRTLLQDLMGGFVMCRNAELDQVGTSGETERIETILNGGFYLE